MAVLLCLAVLLLWQWQQQPAAPVATVVTPATPQKPARSASPAPQDQPLVESTTTQPVEQVPVDLSKQANPTAPTGTLPDPARILDGLQPLRQTAPLVHIDGRSYRIAGTRLPKTAMMTQAGAKPANTSGPLPVLVIQDQDSGELRFYRSGLLFSLQNPNNYANFIAQHPAMQLRFVNQNEAEVLVQAEDLGLLYNKLRRDPQIRFVRFLPLSPPQHPK